MWMAKMLCVLDLQTQKKKVYEKKAEKSVGIFFSTYNQS